MRSGKLFILCVNQNPSSYKMDTIFINSENSKTSEPHVLMLKLTNKLDSRIGEKNIALSNILLFNLLVFFTHAKT